MRPTEPRISQNPMEWSKKYVLWRCDYARDGERGFFWILADYDGNVLDAATCGYSDLPKHFHSLLKGN